MYLLEFQVGNRLKMSPAIEADLALGIPGLKASRSSITAHIVNLLPKNLLPTQHLAHVSLAFLLPWLVLLVPAAVAMKTLGELGFPLPVISEVGKTLHVGGKMLSSKLYT